MIADWRDSRIDGTYSAGCLRGTLRDLPEDLRIYGSAEQDITRALNAVLVQAQARRAAARTLASSHAKTPAKSGRAASRPATTENRPSPPKSRTLAGRHARTTPSTHEVAAAVATRVADDGSTGFPVRIGIVVAAALLTGAAVAASIWRTSRRGPKR